MLHSTKAMDPFVEPYFPEFDIAQIDDGIRGAVLHFRNAGFKTFTSCEGGEGHCFRLPTVGILIRPDNVHGIVDHIKSVFGWGSKDISVRYAFGQIYLNRHRMYSIYVEGEKLLSIPIERMP